jgi:transcriptional regulator with XRE-family HTH domain
MPGLLFAQVRFIHQSADFLLAQVVPALVYSNLVKPSPKSGTQIEPLQRKIRLYKHLLRHIFNVFAPPQYSAYHCEDPLLVLREQLFVSSHLSGLRLPDENSLVNDHSLGAIRLLSLNYFQFWDVRHSILVTSYASQRFLWRNFTFCLRAVVTTCNNGDMIIGDRLRAMREEKKLSQGDIEKRTGLLRCYISRVENGHTVPAIETLEKMARALEVPLYQLFYDGEEPPELPNLPKRKSADDIAFGTHGKEARFLNKLRRLLGRIEEPDRRLLLYMAQKMSTR